VAEEKTASGEGVRDLRFVKAVDIVCASLLAIVALATVIELYLAINAMVIYGSK
jgi:hypothetical protein